MKVLVINCGSSSLKYQLIDMDNEQMVCKGNFFAKVCASASVWKAA